MDNKQIRNCSSFYGYGNIDDRIIAEHYYWDELDNVSPIDIVKILKGECVFPYLYLFTSRECFYPTGKIDEYLGLWKYIKKEYKFETEEQTEQKYIFNQYIAFCGIAQFRLCQMDIATKLLQTHFRTSFMAFSCRDHISYPSFRSFLNITPKSYSVDFSKVINCDSGFEKIITMIDGSGGSSLNIFHYQ